MKKFLMWLGTAVQDAKGDISSKRIALYWAMFILQQSAKNPQANEIVIYTVAALILGLVGLTIPEWFSNLSEKPRP